MLSGRINLVGQATFISHSNSDSDDDDDGLPPDPGGISRVSEALQAHMWPKMEMAKTKRGSQSGRDNPETGSGKAAAGDDEETEVKEKKEAQR